MILISAYLSRSAATPSLQPIREPVGFLSLIRPTWVVPVANAMWHLDINHPGPSSMTRRCLAYGPLTADGDISTILSVHQMLPGLLIATGRDADTTKVKG